MDMSNLENLPLAAPPAGVIPNFIDPQSQAYAIRVGMGISIAVASMFILLRFFTKIYVIQKLGWDDLTCLLSWILILTHDSLTFTIIGGGVGRPLGLHLWDIQLKDNTIPYLQKTFAAVDVYAVAALFVKLSLFILYLRIFRPNRLTRMFTYTGIAAISIFYPICIIIDCVLCIPKPADSSNLSVWLAKAERCSPFQDRIAFAQGIFGTISDTYLLIIPIQMVLRLNLSKKRKIGVCAIFLTGIIAIICSIGTLVYRTRLLTDLDSTWISAEVFIFSNAEVAAGIVCSSAPILPSLFTWMNTDHASIFRLSRGLRDFVTKLSGSSRRQLVSLHDDEFVPQAGSLPLQRLSEQDVSSKTAGGL